MQTEQLVYKLLERFEKALEEDDPDFSDIKAENIGISLTKWNNVLLLMEDEGYIKGVYDPGGFNTAVHISGVKITLKGIRYLAENSNMAKFIRAAKEIAAIIPK